MKVLPLDIDSKFYNVCHDIIDSAMGDDEIIANYFVVRGGQSGMEFCKKLYLASCRGARVTLIIDSYGSLMPSSEGTEYRSPPLPLEVLYSLVQVGGQVFIYHPLENPKMFSWKNMRNWNNFARRNHNKNLIFNLRNPHTRGLVIGDGQWSDEHFNGEMKGSNLYIESNQVYLDSYCYQKRLIHSEHVEPISLSTAEKYQNVFGKIGDKVHSRPSLKWYFDDQFFYPKSMKYVASAIDFKRGKDRHNIQDYEIQLLESAKDMIHYTTPYFSPDTELQDALIQSQKKIGDELRILIGKFRHDPYLPYGVRKVAKRLLKFDMGIYEYSGLGNIHYKDMVVDNHCFVKTANGEGRSRFYNLETGVMIEDGALANKMRNFIKRDINHSVRMQIGSSYLSQHPWWHRPAKTFLCPLYFKHL